MFYHRNVVKLLDSKGAVKVAPQKNEVGGHVMTGKTAKLSIPQSDNNTLDIELPVYEGSLGPDVIDVAKLTSQGHFTFDPGFTSTASCESKITFIDGEKRVLLHRDYPIAQLAEQSDYLETCYLLLNGELPNAE